MNRQLIIATLAVLVAAGAALPAPAKADPPSGDTAIVVMQLPGPLPPPTRSGPDESYKPPFTTMTVQGLDGAGVDRDGTTGFINTQGTDGIVTGPILVARPQYLAAPPALPAHAEPLP